MNKIKKQLLDVVEYSESMLKDAQAGNWDRVIDIEVQRNELLENLFSGSSCHNEFHDIDSKIHQIIAINKKIENAAADARNGIQDDLTSLNKGRHAVGCYAQNTG